jgi:predicted alpha-1,2-mannosidase
MKKILTPIILLAMISATAQRDYTQYVNPMIGTNGMGHTFPGACYPFGGVQVSPDTDTIPHNVNGKYQPGVYDYCAGYQYRDLTIVGFSHTHFSGTGHSDMGDILLMPFTGEVQLNPGTADNPDGGYRSRFSHATEKASPGYYEVRLSDDDILVQLTATPHCGIHRYTFPKGKTQKLIVDLNHAIYNYDGKVLWASLRMEDPYTLTGYRITNGWARENYVYFAIHFSKPVAHYGYQDFGKQDYHGFWGRFDVNHDFPEMAGRKVVAWLEFEQDDDPVLEVQVGLSAVSAKGADFNLTEAYDSDEFGNDVISFEKIYHRTFEKSYQKTKQAWNERLSIYDAKGTADQLAMFYTSLYHTMINPSVYQDVDGQYRGVDHNIHQNEYGHTNYTIFSLWDTYRAEHPLLNIIDPKSAVDMAESMLNHAKQSVHHALPVWSHAGNENWCMIGYHGVSAVVDAFLLNKDKFLYNVNMKGEAFLISAMPYILNSSNLDYYDHTDLYKKLGYIPYNKSVVGTSITLENAYEDWVIYHLMDKGNIAPEYKNMKETYRQRALNFKNVFNPETGFAQARYEDGSWKTPADLLSTANEGFIEGNSWNYSFYVPHDVNGLIKIMGGDKVFVNRLDELFTMYVPDKFFAETEDVTREGMLGGYVHGNEPSHHIPYLYMWTSQPWKTQLCVREVMNKMYRNHLDGLCGNDDCGQMSAWYIFSAMGFYPVCPASGQYVFGAPYLPENVLHLQNGNTLTIKAPNVSDQNCYIQSVTLNGQPLHTAYITYEQIMAGGELVFTMGSKPNKKWFTEKPYSLE